MGVSATKKIKPTFNPTTNNKVARNALNGLKVATDIDGVLAYNKEDRKLYRPHRMHLYYRIAKPTGFIPDTPYDIITSRKQCYRNTTVKWLEKYEIPYWKIFMFPMKVKKTFENVCEHKADWINELGIEVYYEDHTELAQNLKVLTDAKIVLVKYNAKRKTVTTDI